MRMHMVLLLAPLVVASDAAIAASTSASGASAGTAVAFTEVHEDVELAEVEAEPLPRHEITERVIRSAMNIPLPEAEPSIELEEVRWTVPARMRVSQLALRWGVNTSALLQLNPELGRGDAFVEPEQELVVWRDDPNTQTISIGAPNRGRLRGGIPLPEGSHWKMRDHRPRAYGTRWTIESLVTAFEAYGKAFPDGPPIHLGEISARTGGRARPHVSHRTGRDVDIGYILQPGALGDRHWRAADEETFDVEKNWFLIKALVDTGRVQSIFVSSRLQKLLIEEARKELSEEEVARYFRHARAESEDRPLISHWKGHRDHMHVRFKCHPDNRRCQASSRY